MIPPLYSRIGEAKATQVFHAGCSPAHEAVQLHADNAQGDTGNGQSGGSASLRSAFRDGVPDGEDAEGVSV